MDNHVTALILRRCYPIPVTFKDLRAARCDSDFVPPWQLRDPNGKRRHPKFRSRPPSRTIQRWWSASLKSQVGALDEVFAVIGGREVRVAVADHDGGEWGIKDYPIDGPLADDLVALMRVAERDGYWERPHVVRVECA